MSVDAKSDGGRFVSQLPFYVNGTLAPTERAWMDEVAASDPSLQRALAAEMKFAQLVQAAVESEQPSTSTEVALGNALAAWRGRYAKEAWWHAFTNLPSVVLTAISALAAMSLAQWAYIAIVLAGAAYAPSRSLNADCRLEPMVRFTLRPDARWEDLVVLVRSQGLLLRQGPTESGQVLLAVPSGKTAEAVVSAVSADKSVQLAEVMPPMQSPECKP